MSSVIETQTPEASASIPSETKFQLAIIGCGPRGLQCLETISRHLSPAQLSRLSITIFEPAPYPGAGCVYDPTQPRQLIMNFATQHIDFWKFAANQTTSRSNSLIGWLSTRYSEYAKSDQYIPRAIVGEYLADCLDIVLRKFGRGQVKFLPQKITALKPSRSGWAITSKDGKRWSADQVVLTTGHEGLRKSDALDEDDSHNFVLPTQRQLTSEQVPAGSHVRINGFGLTAIDAILSLTVGRGGTFDQTSGSLPKYQSSVDEPHCIDIHSRSGRPMLAKPTAAVEPISDTFWEPFRRQLAGRMAAHGTLHFRRDIWDVMIKAAAELLDASGIASSPIDVESWFRGWSRYKMNAASARRAMLQSYAVATGKRAKDIPYALAEAWRNLYPEMTRLISYGGLANGHWQDFLKISREMERIAFGPPAENVGRLLSLMRHGIVQIEPCGARASRPHQMQSGRRDAHAPNGYDCTINAIIAPPHQANPGGPIAGLIEQGRLELDEETGAVKVDASGHAVGSALGLAVFGRATEGWIVGNDTLTRTLHTQMEAWGKELTKMMEAKSLNST